MSAVDVSKYEHSPVHKAIILKDYAGLRRILAGLPRLCDPSEIHTESASLAEEAKADAIAASIDRRDVPNRDTPLHLAVNFGDETAAEMLMLAGADWSLQNEHGWSALQEAICNREEGIAKIIVRHYQPLAWAKWCRRLPRLIGTMRRMRDFYMEITFHFESSVIPFISRIAPSDTYKIWKRGANLRADMTLAGFDGFRIQRADQSILFLGDGSEDGQVPPGSLCMISHKIRRPGIDVTQAVLLPQTTWRRQEKTEMVGPWKAKVDEFEDILTEEERRQLEVALKMDSSDLSNENGNGIIAHRHSCYDQRDIPIEDINGCMNGETKQEKKGWFSGWRRRENKQENEKKIVPPRSSLCMEEKVNDLLEGSPRSQNRPGRHSVDVVVKRDELRRGRDGKSPSSTNSESGNRRKDGSRENEYKKGLRPILWLSPDFPLRTEELLPLLDILANKVKAVRRLRELFTTKLPKGTFPVKASFVRASDIFNLPVMSFTLDNWLFLFKVAIPVVPTIRVMVTFTKFEELQPLDEFSTPPSSPTPVSKESPSVTQSSGSSWFQWIKSPYQRSSSSRGGPSSRTDNTQDPFTIPSDYSWITAEAKKKKMQEKSKAKKVKSQK
ncbi:UNVERIFIED_CONTAM: Ankyrin repeat domain-containing protein 13B [Sesamum latifolium]|uniref:Ankyrin repeat domain-containing protein 13B n=1 Tax=Sesamum latifolium TaxID=2727402 RepID=A0AAW2XUN2_9LAMI